MHWRNLYQRQITVFRSGSEGQTFSQLMLTGILEMHDSWKVDIASVFSQIAYIGLPENITEDVYYKRKVPIPVRKLLAEFLKDTQKILDKIPGLEEIGEILQRVDVQPRFEEYDDRNIRISASILKVCLESIFMRSKDTISS